MRSLYTIGYERASRSAVIDELRAGGVEVLIDVRLTPHSRRKAFSAKHLGASLPEAGIAYESWPELGAPRVAQEAAKAGDLQRFEQLYREQLATPGGAQALARLTERLAGEAIGLLCYERDPRQCHRRLLAQAVAERCGTSVQDLLPDLGAR